MALMAGSVTTREGELRVRELGAIWWRRMWLVLAELRGGVRVSAAKRLPEILLPGA